jgi:hypothetical protein
MTISPGLSAGTRACSTWARKLSPLIGPSITHGASIRSWRSAARKVSVLQRPCDRSQRCAEPGLIGIEAFYRDGFWRRTVKDGGVGAHGARGVGGRIVKDLARSIGGLAVTNSDSDGTTITVVVPHRS